MALATLNQALRHSAAAPRSSASGRMRSRTRSRDRRAHSRTPGRHAEDYERYHHDRSGRSASPHRRDPSHDRYYHSPPHVPRSSRTALQEGEQPTDRGRSTMRGARTSGEVGMQHNESNAAALEALGVPPPADHASAAAMVPAAVLNMYDTMMGEMRDAKTQNSWNISSTTSPAATVQSAARLLPRREGPYINISQVVTIGVLLCAAGDEAAAEARSAVFKELSPEKRKMYVNAFEGFLDIVPFLRPTLAILDERPHDVIMLGNFLDHHARNARATDIKTLRDNIRDYVPEVTIAVPGVNGAPAKPLTIAPLPKSSKDNLGFDSLWTARLLVPRSLRDEFDDGPREFCDEIQTGDIVINHNQFPSFLYDDSDFDPDRQFKGLFQGDVLGKPYRAIFTGPSSAFKPPGVSGSARNSISKKYRLDRVRPGSIAYVACLVRFILSTTEQWEGAVNGTFNGEEFYERILKVFQNDAFAFETLSVWNAYVYGDATRRRTNPAAQVDIPNEADLILQQLALQAASEAPSVTTTSASSSAQQPDVPVTTAALDAVSSSSSAVPEGPASAVN